MRVLEETEHRMTVDDGETYYRVSGLFRIRRVVLRCLGYDATEERQRRLEGAASPRGWERSNSLQLARGFCDTGETAVIGLSQQTGFGALLSRVRHCGSCVAI